ncbi:MAG: hypothetical protein PHS51_03360 [Gallionella sp.]|nr:hypothetical protein [Gallionella sp.]
MVFVWVTVINTQQRHMVLFLMTLLPAWQIFEVVSQLYEAEQAQQAFEVQCKSGTTKKIDSTAQNVVAVRQYIDPYPAPHLSGKGLYPFLVGVDRVDGYAQAEFISDRKNGFGVRKTRDADNHPVEDHHVWAETNHGYGLEWDAFKPVAPYTYLSSATFVIKNYETKQILARQNTFALHVPDIFLYRNRTSLLGGGGIVLKPQRYLTCPSAMELHEFVYTVLKPKW